jgi:nucleoside-diphosphate-sugar epimerase
MRVFVAGASGVIGHRLVPQLLAAGQSVVAVMTIQRAADNAKAKREPGWEPTHSSRRDGFRTALE